ncbi:MAG TPA: tRNA (adenosine(37)-N6)-threonylcarbamoyltransferase complex dimerization subunit type 1 TsaB, partial [Dongiaceae bacterium]
MAVIVIDTCLAVCQVGVADGEQLIASACEPMERGHQERLAPMAAEAMARAGLAFGDLSRIAVTIGP